MRNLFRLRLLTAQRPGEVSKMRWEDIDRDSGWWTIPGEFSKNGLSHRVPLSKAAQEILKEMELDRGDSPWVFTSPNDGGPLRSVWRAMRRIREESSVNFVPHDLRRTAASRMTASPGCLGAKARRNPEGRQGCHQRRPTTPGPGGRLVSNRRG